MEGIDQQRDSDLLQRQKYRLRNATWNDIAKWSVLTRIILVRGYLFVLPFSRGVS